jgi:hypothetical protein
MINTFVVLKKIIGRQLNLIIFILNLIILGFIISYTFFFYFGNSNLFLTKLILIFSSITLFLKLLHWYLIKDLNTLKKDNSKIFILRLAFCTFTYLAPTYYIFNQNSLILNQDIVLITLILISIIVSVGIFIERYLFVIELNNSSNLYYEYK